MRKTLLISILALFALPVVANADPPAGADQFSTQASQIIAAATVTYKGNDWGPVPLYTVDLRPALNATIDVADYTADAARNDPGVFNIVETELWQNAGSPPDPQAPPQVSQGATLTDADTPFASTATALVASSPVSYVGNSWGPTPIYEITIASLSLGIDVAATSAGAASSDSGVIAYVAMKLWQNAGSPPAPNNNPAPQTQPSSSPGQTLVAAADVAPLAAVVPAVVPAVAPVAVPVTASEIPAPTPTTYAPSIKITISAPAAKQPTVAATLTKALGTKVTLSKTVRLTSSGKATTLVRVKSLLAKGKSVKISLHKVAGKYVVTGIAL